MATASGIRAGAAYIEIFADDSKLMRGLKTAQHKLKEFGAVCREIGTRMLETSALLATPFVAGAKVFADFEQQMANVSTMVDKPQEHMARFSNGIREMAVQFGESTDTLAKGLYDILSASVAPEKALGVLAVSAKAAKAGLSDTGTAADAITTVLNAYGLSADHAATVSDLLFSIVKRGKLTFSDLAPNIGKVATIASSAGLSLEELGSMIALLTRNGIKTEQAMTATGAIISSLMKPSAEGAKAAKEMGVELSVAALRSEGLAGILKKLAGMPPDMLAKLFPNVEAMRGLLPALNNLEGFATDMDTMRGRAGATEDAYRKMTGTLTHAFAQLREAGLDSLLAIGEAIAEPLAKAVVTIRHLVTAIGIWIGNNRQVVRTTLLVIGAVAAVGAALIAVAGAAATLGMTIAGISALLSALGTVMGVIGGMIAAIFTPVGALNAAIVALSVAIVALGTRLLWTSGAGGKALKWLGNQFDVLRQDALTAWQGISDALAAGDIGLAARVLWLTLKMEWQRGVNFLNKLWVGFKDFFLGTAVDAFYGAVVLMAEAWASMQNAWVDMIAFLGDAWTGFTVSIFQTWNEVQGKLQKGFLDLMGLLDSSLDVEAAKKLVDVEVQQKDEAIAGKGAEDVQAREKRRQDRRADIEQEREGTLIAISEAAGEADRTRREGYARDLAGTEAELAKARAEWQAAIDEAARKRAEVEAGKEQTPDLVDQLKKQVGDLGPTLAKAGSVDVIGTFNAAAVLSLAAGGSAADRTAKATEDTAKNTGRILDELRDDEAAFE